MARFGRAVELLQSFVLPLHYTAIYGYMAGDAGLEPTLTESKSVVLAY